VSPDESGVAWLDDRDLDHILKYGKFIPRSELEHNGYRTQVSYRFLHKEDYHLVTLTARYSSMVHACIRLLIDDAEYRKMQRGPWLLTKKLGRGWEDLVSQVQLVEEWWQRLT
jgi:hypothetical protein